MEKLFLIILFLGSINVLAQEEQITLETETGKIDGTLLIPEGDMPFPVALIIAGSGPTDRDGNNQMMKNNSLKMLAEGLAENGIASVRYDKRGVAKSLGAAIREYELRLDHFVADARAWVKVLSEDERFGDIIVIGHSEGSLIGMIAAQNSAVKKFVSLAGAGFPADQLLRKQLSAQQPVYLEKSAPIMDELLKGNEVDSIPVWLNVLFRPGIQPYLISWFKYDPRAEIAKLEIPVLLLQGTTDIQIGVDDANALAKAKPDAKLIIIEGMNHVLKEAEADRMKNMQTYNQPDLPVMAESIQSISEFIKN